MTREEFWEFVRNKKVLTADAEKIWYLEDNEIMYKFL